MSTCGFMESCGSATGSLGCPVVPDRTGVSTSSNVHSHHQLFGQTESLQQQSSRLGYTSYHSLGPPGPSCSPIGNQLHPLHAQSHLMTGVGVGANPLRIGGGMSSLDNNNVHNQSQAVDSTGAGGGQPTTSPMLGSSPPNSHLEQQHAHKSSLGTPVISLQRLKSFLSHHKIFSTLQNQGGNPPQGHMPNQHVQNSTIHSNQNHSQSIMSSGHSTGLTEDGRPLESSQILNTNPMYGGAVRGLNGPSQNCHPGNMLLVPQALQPKGGLQTNGPNAAPRRYACKMCPQIFGSRADLRLHTQSHMRETKPYKCSQCSKSFASSSYLSQHTRIHLGIKPYRCEICQRGFTQLSHLRQHIRTHTGDKPYKCRHPNCNKAFSQLSSLQSHSRCHQTDKPYKCNSCYKCFTDEASLLDHIPKHKESKHLKTHICQYCGKSYTQETYLAKHMQKHADRLDAKQRSSIATTLQGLGGAGGAVLGPPPTPTSPRPDSNPLYWSKTPTPPNQGHHDHLQHPPSHLDLQSQSQQSHLEQLNPAYDGRGSVSAFTPIQGMLPGSQMAHHQAGGGPPRTPYFAYEPFPSSVAMKAEKPSSSFPNQLISLHQIRNFASMPSSMLSQDRDSRGQNNHQQ